MKDAGKVGGGRSNGAPQDSLIWCSSFEQHMEVSSSYHYQDDDKNHLLPGKYLLLQVWTCDLTQGHIMDCFDEQIEGKIMEYASTFWQVVSMEISTSPMKVLRVIIVQDFTSTFLQVLSMKIFASMDFSSTFWQALSTEIFASF